MIDPERDQNPTDPIPPELAAPEADSAPDFEQAPAVPAERYPFWGWADVAFVALLAFGVLVIASVLTAGVLFVLPSAPKAKAIVPLVATFLFYALFLVALYQFFRFRHNKPFWRSLGWIATPPMRVSPVAYGVFTAFGVILLGAALRTPDIKTPLEQLLADPLSIILMGLFAVTLAPVFEEITFRGFLYPLIARSLGPIPGIVLTALPFALLHGPEYAWSWQRVSLIFLAGSAFGWMRHITGSTAAAAMMHAAYNATFVTALFATKLF